MGGAAIARTQAAFPIEPIMKGEALGLYFQQYEDRDGKLGIQDLVELDRAGRLTPSTEEVPNFGLNPAAQWVKFALHNPSDHTETILLENKFTFVDRFTLYFKDQENQWQTKEAGDQVPFINREIHSRQVVYKLTLDPGTHIFYARSQAEGAHQLPLAIWSQAAFYQHNANEYGMIGILVGFHLVICLYNLFLYFSLKDRTYLVYVIYVAGNILYQGTGLGIFQQILSELSLFERISNKIMIVSVDLIAIAALTFSFMFLNISRKLPRFKKIYWMLGASSALNILVTSLVSVWWGTVFCMVTASSATSILIVSGLLIARKRNLPAVFYLVAWGCYLFGVSGTITNLIGLFPTTLFSRWGQFTGGAFEVAILSLALGARINARRRKQVRKIKELNTTLERKVKERTAEVQSLLLYIPQGIMSIGPRGRAEANYSAQLPEILGHKEISGLSFKSLVLDRSNLSGDAKDQAWQALLMSIGEPSLNFEMNVDKLPLQLEYGYQDLQRILRLTWNPEINHLDEVKHVLVTLLDVTQEVAAQQELVRQNREFDIIRQLVDVGVKRSIQFFSSGNQLIQENSRLIHSGEITVDTVKILFVNAHTLKGAARSLQMKEMANEFHKIESYYSVILKDSQAIDRDRIIREHESAEAMYDHYEKANKEILGRNEDLSKVAVDRKFLQENLKFLRHLDKVKELSGDLKDVIHTYRNELTNLIFMSLPVILEEILQQADKVAKDLNREPPMIHYDVDEILVSYSQERALKNAMVHLIRNALDHGIEPAKLRTSKGKSAAGTISLKATEHDGKIVIEFKDDGRGLAIGRIREKCRSLGMGDAEAAAETIALKIFETGFSTTETVSQISGRGVGMDAVRQFMVAENGTVLIQLGQSLDAAGDFYEFTIKMVLPSISSSFHPLFQVKDM